MVPAVYRVLSLRYLLHRWDRALLIVVQHRARRRDAHLGPHPEPVHRGRGAGHHRPGAHRRTLRHQRRSRRPTGRSSTTSASRELPGVQSVQPLVYDRVSLPDLDGRVAVLIGAEVSLAAHLQRTTRSR